MYDLSREQLLAELRALKPQFEREDVAHMSLFGSRARGDNRPDSDVDVLVDVQPGRKFGLEAVGVFNLIEDRVGLPSSIVHAKDWPPTRLSLARLRRRDQGLLMPREAVAAMAADRSLDP